MAVSLIENVFMEVLNQSILSSWLIIAVIIIRACMKKTPKSLRYVLWTLVAVRLLCPISIESNWSLVPDIDISSQESIADKHFDSVEVEGLEKQDVSGRPELFENLQEYSQEIEVPHPDKMIEVLPEQVLDITDRHTDKDSFSMQEVFPIASWIWLIGIFGISLSSVISVLRLRNKIGASLQVGENVWVCDEIQSPFIFGLISPRIYIPSFVAKEQLPCILAHEKEHLKYRDHWWKPIGFVILTLYWYNPMVWAAYILFCRDIELACDERVIRHMDEKEKKQYSKSLLLCNNPRHLISACPVAFGEIGVKERIKSILNYKKPSTWMIGIGALACIIIAICFMTSPKKADKIGSGNTEQTENMTENNTETVNGPNDATLMKYLEMQMGESLSKEEIEWFQTEFFNAEEDGLLDVSRTTTSEMNAILQKYMNISLEDTNKLYLEYLHYLPAYDAYYKVAGDTEYTQYMIMTGWKNEDGTISLVYHPIAMSMGTYYKVTLKQDGDNYYFLSNLQLPMDMRVSEAKEITEEEALEATSDPEGQVYTSMLDAKNGYVLRCSTPAASQMTKMLCTTFDGGASFEKCLDVSDLRNYPCGVYFFTENIGYIVTDYHGSDNFLYRTEDGGKTWRAQMIYIPDSRYRYINGLSIENGVLQIEVVSDDTSVYYEYITDDMGETWNIVWSRSMMMPPSATDETDTEIITYDGKEYKKSELCDATLRWLELSEQERLLSSYLPREFSIFVENWGVSLTAENITPTGLTLKCTQSGGEPTGELQTGSWYIVETWTQEYGWREIEYVPQEYEPTWTQEAWVFPMNDTCEWEVNWEWLYGPLPKGKYRVGKEIMDFRGPGDFDEAVYYAEFEIVE